MKAIKTQYFGPRARHGSRIRATAETGNAVTVGYDDALDSSSNHIMAARALCDKLDWHGTLAMGWLEGGCNVFVFVTDDTTIKV